MQSAGVLVCFAAKFASCPKYGMNDLKGGTAAFVRTDRDSTPIIAIGEASVSMHRYTDAVAKSGQRFVNTVAYYLDNQMVKPACRSAAYIHARALANVLHPIQNLLKIFAIGLILYG